MVGAGIRTLLGNIFGEEINQCSSKTPNIHCLAGLEHSHLCCHNSHFPTLIQQLYITRRKVIVVKITAFQESGGNARSKVLWCCEESSVLFFWLPLPSSLLLLHCCFILCKTSLLFPDDRMLSLTNGSLELEN